MANISKLNVGGSPYDLRDAASMHYIGHTTTDIVPGTTGATITINSASVTAVANDYVTSGTSNLNYIWNGTAWELLSEAAAEVPVKGVEVNGTALTPDADGIVDIPAATDSTFGVIETGANITNTNGVISVEVATDSVFGVVKTGSNITNTSGVISVADASTSDKGVVQLSTAIPSSGAVDTKVATEKAVADAIAAMPEPMVFRGTVGAQADNPTITALPVDGTAKVGDTYKVITNGTYAGEAAEVGDTFICRTKTPAANTWVLIPSGDEPDGTVTSVGVASTGTGLTITTSAAAGGPIVDSGTITVGIESGYQFMTEEQATKVATIGTQAAVYNSVTASDTAAATNSVVPARVGDTSKGEDAETLYIDFLNFGTANVIGKATS